MDITLINKKFNIFNINILISIFAFLVFISMDLIRFINIPYLDELIAILMLLYLLFAFVYDNIKRSMLPFILTITIICVIGLISSVVNFSNMNVINNITDIFLFVKPFIFFLFGMLLKDKSDLTLKSIRVLSKATIVIVFASFLIFIATSKAVFYSIFDKNAFGFLATHAGSIANPIILCLTIICSSKSKTNIIYGIMAAIIIFAIDSGIGKLGLLLIIYFFLFLKYFRPKIRYVILFGIVIVMLSMDEITNYLTNTSAVRYLMIYYGIITALRYFPFGSGFATYGSTIAKQDYSYLYYEYGFNHIYGMMPGDDGMYLSDTYYSMIIGQFGFIGTMVFLIFLLIIFAYINKLGEKNKQYAAYTLFLYVLAMGLGFNIGGISGCSYFLLLGIFLKDEEIHIFHKSIK